MKPAETWALLLYAAEGASSASIGAITSVLQKFAGELPSVRMLASIALSRILGRDVSTAVGDCGGSIECICELGRRADAQKIVFGRLLPPDVGARGMRLQILVIDVATKTVLRKSAVHIESVVTLDTLLLSHVPEIFAVSSMGRVEILGYRGAVKRSGSVIGTGPGPIPLEVGQHRLELDRESMVVVIMPDRTTSLHYEAKKKP